METVSELNLEHKKFINIGGCSKNFDVPHYFNNWQHILLDIDKSVNPDVICDARELKSLEPAGFDAVYCANMLEHVYHHEVLMVLEGIHHILKQDGFLIVRVPNLKNVFQEMLSKNLEFTDVLYEAACGPILVGDVIWGYHVQIQKSKNDYFAHKYGFSEASLRKFLVQSGFFMIAGLNSSRYDIGLVAFKQQPTKFHEQLFQVKFPHGT